MRLGRVASLVATAAAVLLAMALPAHAHTADEPHAPPAPTAATTPAGQSSRSVQRKVDPRIAARMKRVHAARRALARAWRAAPRERNGRCVRSVDVPGMGRACRASGGLWRVAGTRGRRGLTHGPDLPAHDQVRASVVGSAGTAASTASGTSAHITCVSGAGTGRTQLVYAVPHGATSRYTERLAPLRTAFYTASAQLDATAKQLDPDAGARFTTNCDAGGDASVIEAQLATSTAAHSFTSIVNDLKALGHSDTDTNYLVFYEGALSMPVAGQAWLYDDDRLTASNASNLGASYAVQYNWGDFGPDWSTLLHEAAHNMGAVQHSAPNASGLGHCADGTDVMCYDDGGALLATNPYTTTRCATLAFDCGNDDYFHPSPAPDSYLATHWNLAHSYNRFLDTTPGSAPLLDGTAPSEPGAITVEAKTASTVSVSWQAATDNVGVVAYRLYAAGVFGSYQLVAEVTGTSYTFTDLWPGWSTWVGVRAVDEAGNVSPERQVTVTTLADDSAPTAAANLRPVQRTITSLRVAWDPASDDTGILQYEVYRVLTSGDLKLVARPTSTERTVGGLMPGTTYQLGVRAIDWGYNPSPTPTWVKVRTTDDRTAPSRPGRPALVKRERTALTVRWAASADNHRVARYRVQRYMGGRWRTVCTTTRTSMRVTGLSARTWYRLRVRAVDPSGNQSLASAVRRTRTA